MMDGGMNSGMGGFLGFGFLGILLIAAIIMIVIWMMKPGSGNKNSRSSNDQTIQVLNQRLARGEISEEEYDRLKNKMNN